VRATRHGWDGDLWSGGSRASAHGHGRRVPSLSVAGGPPTAHHASAGVLWSDRHAARRSAQRYVVNAGEKTAGGAIYCTHKEFSTTPYCTKAYTIPSY